MAAIADITIRLTELDETRELVRAALHVLDMGCTACGDTDQMVLLRAAVGGMAGLVKEIRDEEDPNICRGVCCQ